MTPKERLWARLRGEPVDKVPNLNIVMLFAAQHAKIPYGEFCSDYKKLVEAQLKTARDFGIDILSTMSDPYREVADFGARVRFQADDLPVCEETFLKSTEDFARLQLWDPMQSVRMRDRIEAVRLFKELCGEEYPILGWVEGAWAEFTDLTTVSEGMLMLFDEPELVQEVMERITEQEIRCALAQIAAGADVIGMGDAAASLISADSYREFVLPMEQKITQAVHNAGAKMKLHICGNITHLLPDMMAVGADIVDIDYMVDFAEAVQLAASRCSICGNLNPIELLLQGKPEQIRDGVRRCLEQCDTKSIISSGCEIPRATPPENVLAVAEQLAETK